MRPDIFLLGLEERGRALKHVLVDAEGCGAYLGSANFDDDDWGGAAVGMFSDRLEKKWHGDSLEGLTMLKLTRGGLAWRGKSLP